LYERRVPRSGAPEAYILGEIMGLDHRTAAEVLDVSPAAFRKAAAARPRGHRRAHVQALSPSRSRPCAAPRWATCRRARAPNRGAARQPDVVVSGRNVIPHLRCHCRVLAPELVGCGDSAKLPGTGGNARYSFAEHQADVDALLDELDVREDVVLVGYDRADRWPSIGRAVTGTPWPASPTWRRSSCRFRGRLR
jgi:hypothetical protein